MWKYILSINELDDPLRTQVRSLMGSYLICSKLQVLAGVQETCNAE